MGIDIRLMTPDDADGIATLDHGFHEPVHDVELSESGRNLTLVQRLDSSFERSWWSDRRPDEEVAKWKARAEQGYKLWGAFSGQRLVGYCAIDPREPGNCRLRDTVEILALFADREFRGQGIGMQFVGLVEEECRALGRKGIYVGTSLNGTAIEFYIKAGFHLVGLHDRVRQWTYGRAAFYKEVNPEPGHAADG